MNKIKNIVSVILIVLSSINLIISFGEDISNYYFNISVLSWLILMTITGYFFIKKIEKNINNNLKNFEYKVGEITNNIGESYFKIVARENENKEYLELSNIPLFYKYEKLGFPIPFKKFNKKEKAEKMLKKYLVEIGKLEIQTILEVQ